MFRQRYRPEDLGPDHAAERLVTQKRARVVERLAAEAEQRSVRLHGHLDVMEPALVPVRHGLVEVRAPPVHWTAGRACGRAAEGNELR